MDWTECAEKLPDKPGKYLVVVSGYHGYRCRKIVSFFITSLYTGKNGPGGANWVKTDIARSRA